MSGFDRLQAGTSPWSRATLEQIQRTQQFTGSVIEGAPSRSVGQHTEPPAGGELVSVRLRMADSPLICQVRLIANEHDDDVAPSFCPDIVDPLRGLLEGVDVCVGGTSRCKEQREAVCAVLSGMPK